MIIYNVTTNIDKAIHDEWVTWMKTHHIPAMLSTGKFVHAKMCRVLIEEEMGGFTYSVQYTSKNKATLESYYKEDAERMRSEVQALFHNKYVAFRTELQLIDEQES
jgi:hypothetical protein